MKFNKLINFTLFVLISLLFTRMAAGNTFPPLPEGKGLTGIPELCLYSGAKFVGEKKWLKARQHFEVEFQHVDRENDLLYGMFTVKGKNRSVTQKLTYFEGEIIGPKHSFLTRKWCATAEIDRKHWLKFDCFCKYGKSFSKDGFDYAVLKNTDQIYMRWKERPCRGNIGFVSPGFFYVCLNKSNGIIEGIYYERHVEEWNHETICLKHVTQRSVPVFQFR